jgi:hypothetical protein
VTHRPLLETLAPIVSPRADAISALVDNADRLGLKWNLRPGTVAADNLLDSGNQVPSNAIPVVLDGDTATILAVPLAGVSSTGARVMVLQVPPGGNFIIGSPVPQLGPSQLIFSDKLSGTGITGVTNVNQAIPGMTKTYGPIVGTFQWEVTGFFDFNVTTGGATAVLAQLTSPSGVEASLPIFGIPTTGLRATVGMVWSGTATSPASFSFVTRKAAALGAVDLVTAQALVRIRQ